MSATAATITISMTRRVATAMLALLATSSCALAQDAADRAAEAARRDKEATTLFVTIVRDVVDDMQRPFETCEIEAK